jgi:hypothetical protein
MTHMRRTESHRDVLVRLTVLDNEATALLAEQRLRQQGIPSFSRSLQGGPGLWGSAFNLPHALYVHSADEMRAREALNLVPLEVLERDGPRLPPRRQSRQYQWWVVALVVLIAALLVITAAPLAARLYG